MQALHIVVIYTVLECSPYRIRKTLFCLAASSG
ncbi:unnamed protein product [Schistosoma curassoni]|uniref:Uncharacterized protein n=1 Tax=Schistosoma curassoni TaxID=6186 RepID=A0A183K1W0_9TREM|nr:unnamed protein product [Schistosoma curassoni]